MSSTYRERPVQFGPGRGLFGMLCMPATEDPDGGPVVVMLNSGLVHRAGVNRIHVLLARAMAEIGLRSLRFDLSGIGDSARRPDATSLDEAVRRDIDDALEYLAEGVGAESFVLFGLCSGAYDGLRFAESDPRVEGVVAVDVFGSFHNLRHVIVHYTRRLFRRSAWEMALTRPRAALHALRRRLRGASEEDEPAEERDEGGIRGVRPALLRGELDSILTSLRDRGGRALFLFGGGLEDNYNYRHQFRDRYPRLVKSGTVDYRFFREWDHTFTSATSRDDLVRTVTDWLVDVGFDRRGTRSPGQVPSGDPGPSAASAGVKR